MLRAFRSSAGLALFASACLTPSGAGPSAGSAGTPRAIATTAAATPAKRVTSGSGALVARDRPPSPPATSVPRPSAIVTSPGLRVLPWAGFKSAVTYTFDDTQPSQTEHWPELEATGVPMTFFANPKGSREQASYDADWSRVTAAGSELGNHTSSHCRPDLTGCLPVGTAGDEIDQASAYIASRLGMKAVTSFAAPFGNAEWNKLAASRFLIGRGVVNGTVPPSGITDWYNLPCFPVSTGQTATAFNAGIDRARAQGHWLIFLFHTIRPTTADWYAGVDIAGITASIAHAKSLGDVWIDTMTEVGAYARAQQTFERLTPTNNVWTWTLPAHFPPHKFLRVMIAGGTLTQAGQQLAWDPHGYYEVALDAGPLTWAPCPTLRTRRLLGGWSVGAADGAGESAVGDRS